MALAHMKNKRDEEPTEGLVLSGGGMLTGEFIIGHLGGCF